LAACQTFSAIALLKPQLRGAIRRNDHTGTASLSPPLASAIYPAKLLGRLLEVAGRRLALVNIHPEE
jgi:hypothetical protein